MITIPQALIETVFLPGLLAATRVVGLFLSAPFFALQTIPGRFRIGLALVVAFGIPLQVGALTTISINTSTAGFMVLAGTELLIGLAMGWVIRVGLVVFDLAAEVLSIQTGLSFASNYNPDQALPSGVLGTLFGLVALALMFSLNLHLVAIEVLFDSFRSLPPGQWPKALEVKGIASLLRDRHHFGLAFCGDQFGGDGCPGLHGPNQPTNESFFDWLCFIDPDWCISCLHPHARFSRSFATIARGSLRCYSHGIWVKVNSQ
jgi:flagellar biosynthesis protein FliR